MALQLRSPEVHYIGGSDCADHGLYGKRLEKCSGILNHPCNLLAVEWRLGGSEMDIQGVKEDYITNWGNQSFFFLQHLFFKIASERFMDWFDFAAVWSHMWFAEASSWSLWRAASTLLAILVYIPRI